RLFVGAGRDGSFQPVSERSASVRRSTTLALRLTSGATLPSTLPPSLPPPLPPPHAPSRPPPPAPAGPLRPGPSPDGGSLVLRFGTAIGLAAAAALACALPAAMRVAAVLGAEGTGRAWTGLAASALVPMVATVLTLRGAREGLRAFGGPGAELRAYGMALWAVWLVVALALFGSVLRATTHQHALAGVTFAFGELALAVGLALASARVVELLRDAAVGGGPGLGGRGVVASLRAGARGAAARGGARSRLRHAVRTGLDRRPL